MNGQPGQNNYISECPFATRFPGKDTQMTSQLNIAIIRKLHAIHDGCLCTTRHWLTSSLLMHELNVSNVCLMMEIIGRTGRKALFLSQPTIVNYWTNSTHCVVQTLD